MEGKGQPRLLSSPSTLFEMAEFLVFLPLSIPGWLSDPECLGIFLTVPFIFSMRALGLQMCITTSGVLEILTPIFMLVWRVLCPYFLLYSFIQHCMYACVCHCVWRSEDRLQDLFGSLLPGESQGSNSASGLVASIVI